MEKKVVIITGGGKGIGHGIAVAFAKAEYNVVITGRTESRLKSTAESLMEKYNTEVIYFVADGGKEEDVKKVVKGTLDKFGRIDVLINNAQASMSGKLINEHSKEDFDLAIYTGLYATFFYMRECFEALKVTQGCVINFASGAGFAGRLGQSSYAAAKEGIRGFSRVAATEWGEYGINVNVLAPLVETEELKKWKENYPEIYKKTISNIPMQRFGDDEKDVGGTCLFLASEAAKYITGETITLQGGSGLRP